MTDQEEQPLKETKRKERLFKEDTERLAKEQVRKKALFAKEQTIAEAQEAIKLKVKKQSSYNQ